MIYTTEDLASYTTEELRELLAGEQAQLRLPMVRRYAADRAEACQNIVTIGNLLDGAKPT